MQFVMVPKEWVTRILAQKARKLQQELESKLIQVKSFTRIGATLAEQVTKEAAIVSSHISSQTL